MSMSGIIVIVACVVLLFIGIITLGGGKDPDN